MFFLSFLFCSTKKETKKAVENQLLRCFSMARVPTASDVGIYRTNYSCHKTKQTSDKFIFALVGLMTNKKWEFKYVVGENTNNGGMFFLSFLFCSAKKETKKAVENQLLRWFSMARAPMASDVGIYRTNYSCHKTKQTSDKFIFALAGLIANKKWGH